MWAVRGVAEQPRVPPLRRLVYGGRYVPNGVVINQGTIRNCSAEFAQLSANCFNYAKIYIGGLVGENAASRVPLWLPARSPQKPKISTFSPLDRRSTAA